MTTPRYQVIVAGGEPSTVDDLARRLRDDGTVRTAYTVEALLEALDDEVDVVLIAPDLAADGLDAVLRDLRSRVPACQVGVLDPDNHAGTFEIPPARERGELHSLGDAVVGDDPGAVRDAVRRLAARARYRRHLDEYYGLAEERAAWRVTGDDPEGDIDQLDDQIERLRRDLDAQFDDLEGTALFEAALSGTERAFDPADTEGDDTEER